MKLKIISGTLISVILFIFAGCQNKFEQHETIAQEGFWQAGVNRMVITPEESMWMAGYAARNNPSKGKIHDLWVKALAIEDESGNKAVLVTTDIIGYSRELSESICKRLEDQFNLKRENIILSSSHTHSCPVCNKNLINIYPPFDEKQMGKINEYQSYLEEKVVSCTSNALDNMEPASLSSGIGIARFAVNRRENTEEEVLYGSELKGPSDHSVPVFKLSDPNENIKAIVVGYACHATTLDGLQYSGDYPGFAQIELEKAYPGATAMFFAGCGADQNPIPRRTIALAEQFGRELSAAVIRVLKEPMKVQVPQLLTSYNEIELDMSDPPSLEELHQVKDESGGWQAQWANYYIEKINKGEVLPEKYSNYPIQSWKLGDQILLTLGGEVVVGYALRIKKMWGNDIFVAAYANDVMAYIPTEKVLEEGGYEGDISMRVYSLPSKWAPGIEEKIILEVGEQMAAMDRKENQEQPVLSMNY